MSHRRELSTSNCLRSAQRLGLLETTHLLGTVLPLLALLAGGGLRLAHTKPREAVLGLELLGSHETVVDHTEPCAPAATEGNLEAEQQAAAAVLSTWLTTGLETVGVLDNLSSLLESVLL